MSPLQNDILEGHLNFHPKEKEDRYPTFHAIFDLRDPSGHPLLFDVARGQFYLWHHESHQLGHG